LGELCKAVRIESPVLIGRLPSGCEDDAVDAFVCALVARVVALADGSTGPEVVGDYDAAQLDTVRTEGWIHLPPAGHRLQALAAT
jgi:predicted RNase H-like nuclease